MQGTLEDSYSRLDDYKLWATVTKGNAEIHALFYKKIFVFLNDSELVVIDYNNFFIAMDKIIGKEYILM